MFRILVVEDDAGTRTFVEDVLLDAGYEPIVAGNGLEALEILEEKHIDLMILDVMMPKMDGYELLEQIRSAGMDMPVLIWRRRSPAPGRSKQDRPPQRQQRKLRRTRKSLPSSWQSIGKGRSLPLGF